jgi:uncharacterized protein YndB with AHSA1/START domain
MTATIESMEKGCNCDCELETSRVLNASRARVFGAISDPQQLAQWWGPNGFTNTFEEFDFRVGGTWRFVMHGPDGKNYRNKHTFLEIVKSERVVFDHSSSPRFQLTVTLEDAGAGKTKITWRQRFESAEECERISKYAIAGNEQNLDRLAAHLAQAAAAKPFVIARTFDAPRELVWKAWSERWRLMEWFGPKGFKMPAAKLDFRPGGDFHYCLAAPNGHEMWGRFLYREIVAPEKIVLVSFFSDEAGGVTRHPMSATWPLEMLSTFTLAEENGRTVVTIEWIPLNATEEELATFNAAHEGMKQGWTGTFDQLAAYLAS